MKTHGGKKKPLPHKCVRELSESSKLSYTQAMAVRLNV